ncbi:MAG: DUF3261 domain-containing protein [Myxococcota bacterium]
MSAAGRSALVLAAVFLLTCATGSSPRIAGCAAAISGAPEAAGDFARRYAYTVTGQGVNAALEVVVEKRGTTLVLVAFNEFGAKAFSMVRDDAGLSVQVHLGPLVVVPPKNVLGDLQRVAFLEGVSIGNAIEIDQRVCSYRSRVELLSDRSG